MWYYVPNLSECSNSVPDTGGSPLPSAESPQPFVLLSGTPTQRPFSWPGWARRDWIKLLSGLTCAPSTLARGLAAWTSSLPVSRVSRSLLLGSAPELTMTVGSGQTSAGSSVRFDPVTCSWRTCQVLFDMDYPMSSLTLPPSGSMRNGVCSPRPTLAPPTDANGSGLWPTATASDGVRTSETMGHINGNPSLLGAARMWPTARSSDGASGSTAHSRADFRPTLKQATAMWPSPLARDAKGEGFDNTNLPNTVKMWGTPRASDAARGSDPIRTNDRAGSPTLKSQATAFPHDPTTTTGGSNGMVLNPAFVAALMGLPDGWLMAEPDTSLTNCTLEEMVWSPNVQPKPGGSSRKGSPDEVAT